VRCIIMKAPKGGARESAPGPTQMNRAKPMTNIIRPTLAPNREAKRGGLN